MSLYGFGGIGKTSLLEIFREIAQAQNIKIEPRLPRNEIVSKSISTWMSDVFLFKQRGPQSYRQEEWRDFLSVIQPGTVVLIDTIATVNMVELNETLLSLSAVFEKERPECLIVTATRVQPTHRGKTSEIIGLSSMEIEQLATLREWNPEVISNAETLQKQTDGNPLLIECICEDDEMWRRFKSGKLDLSRHVQPIAIVFKEIWDSLSHEGKETVKIISLLSHYLQSWNFLWGRDYCLGLIGPSWDELFMELKEKCIIKEKEEDTYEMHELISAYSIRKIDNKEEELEKIGKFFQSIGKEEVAIRFFAEAMDGSGPD
jgi:hypothetical protein